MQVHLKCCHFKRFLIKLHHVPNCSLSHFGPLSCFRIGDPQAIHPHTHQHSMLNPAPCRLPLDSSLSDAHPFGPPHGSEPVAACPPHALCPAATGPEPAPARHDHSPAHHGYIYHHRNHVIAGYGQPGRAQFHQCGQLRLVRG